jgi:predicted acylesterase/phospholipase RssA
MKGGITSGVVYPHAICELAQTYRFVSIGGTSAGAIAAAAAAAAEHGRESGGFAKLAELPQWVGSGTNLFDLFQPQSETRGAYLTFAAGLGRKGMGKWGRVVGTALRHWWPAVLVGAVPGLAVVAAGILADGSALLRVAAVLAGALLALLGAVLVLLAWLTTRAPAAVTRNYFGLCTGMPSEPGRPALTPWLADLIDDLAGKDDGTPLTFGDLRARGVELQMMTTSLTQRRPHRLPWDERVFFFHPSEWRELFPERIVRWLIEHPPPVAAGEEDAGPTREAMLPRLPLPTSDDLPVVVAARMSLSFPVLISAVPLWAFDRTRTATNRVLSGRARPGDEARPESCWFSDGGITSNFPVHFFDTPLPLRPTFAIDLDGFHPDFPRADDEAKNVWLPDNNVSGILRSWHRFEDEHGTARLTGFVSAIVRTMQNHVDSALTHQPGYRDRIVHVHSAPDEGGMNLTMPPEVIAALTRRGQEAARLLVQAFASDEPTSAWDNHRWVRYRASLAALGALTEEVAAGWASPPHAGRTYRDLLERPRDEPPRSYRVTAAQRELLLGLSEALAAAGAALAAARPVELGGENAPHPEPVARIVPRD